MKVDDYGRLTGNVKLLRPLLFPLLLSEVRESDLERQLAECEDAGLVRLYEVEGKRFVVIKRFGQRVRADKSKYPPPPDQIVCLVPDECPTGAGPPRPYSEAQSNAPLSLPEADVGARERKKINGGKPRPVVADVEDYIRRTK
jgi:hypothetical protein